MNGAIPVEHRRLKYLAQLNMGQSPSSEDVTRFDEGDGLPFLQGNAEFASVASPVFDHNNDAVAALAISGPVYRISRDDIPRLGEAVATAAEELSEKLGNVSSAA